MSFAPDPELNSMLANVRRSATRAALEQAAKCCDEYAVAFSHDLVRETAAKQCARRIRALSGDGTARTEGEK